MRLAFSPLAAAVLSAVASCGPAVATAPPRTARERSLVEELLPAVALNLEVLQRNLRTQELLVQTRDQAEELEAHRGWGHSSFDQAMQVAEMAGVKRLAMTHHDPEHDDDFLLRMEKLCQERFPNTQFAREGMEICGSIIGPM